MLHYSKAPRLQYSKALNIFAVKATELWTWLTAASSHGTIDFTSNLNFARLDKRFFPCEGVRSYL
jgi:hypothetical protein